MTKRSFVSVDTSASTDSFVSAGLISSPSVDFLMSVIQDKTKLFYIKKPVIGANNTIALIYTKEILWIGGIPFPFLDDT